MDLYILLDKLEELLETSVQIPLSGFSVVKAEQALELLEDIKKSLPDKIRQAELLIQEKEQLIFEAKAEAEKIKLEAEEYAAKLVDENQVLIRAIEEAERIKESAKVEARQLQEEAEQYAKSVLESLQETLYKTVKVIEEDIRQLD
jgi:cell division septum initiation protein DivIVA